MEAYVNWHHKLIKERRKSQGKIIFKHSIFSEMGNFFGAHQAIKIKPSKEELFTGIEIINADKGPILVAGIPFVHNEKSRFISNL
jgi:hypothetical protein